MQVTRKASGSVPPPSEHGDAEEKDDTEAGLAYSTPVGAITVDAAVDKLSFGRLQMVVFITAMTAHFSNSAFYELSIYVKPALASEFRYTELEHGELQAVGFAAQLAGAFLSSMLMDRFGRKPLLVFAALVYTVGSALQSVALTYGTLMKLRVFAGMAPGILQATVPVYLSEFCDPASRGFYVSAYNVGYPVGACFFVLLAAALHGHWRASFAAAVVPGVFMLIQLAFLPESPRFLAVSGQHEKASGVVDLMYRWSGRQPPPLRADLAQVTKTDDAVGLRPSSAYVRTFLRIVPLYACLAFASVGVRNWLPTFFAARDFPYQSVFFMNGMDLIGCLVGSWGAERYGCALVITVGFAGSAASTLPLTTYTSLGSRSLLGGIQQCTQAFVWVSLGTLSCEVFPTHCRGMYMGVIFIIITLCTSFAPIVGGYFFAQGAEARVTAIYAYGLTYLLGALCSAIFLFDVRRFDTILSKPVSTYGTIDSADK